MRRGVRREGRRARGETRRTRERGRQGGEGGDELYGIVKTSFGECPSERTFG
jgi:hypothetical protein